MFLVRKAPVFVCALSLLVACGDDGDTDGTGGSGNSGTGNSGTGAEGGGGGTGATGTGAGGTGNSGTGAGGTGAGGTGAGGTGAGGTGGMPACTTAGDCDDSDACTTDTCDNGSCTNAAVDPDDGVGCTDDSCDPVNGVANVVNDANCADATVCNGDETCDAVNDCQAGTPLVMDDGVGCTDDSCDPVNGVANVANDANCADATVCNGIETCDVVNDCQAGTPLVVDDGVACTDDVCDAVNGVSNTPNDANCTNNNVCDGLETCDAVNNCVNGTPPVIDDGVGCTDDSCDPIAGVLNAPNDANCDDSDVCTGVDSCDAVNDCQNPVLPVCGACVEVLYDNGAEDPTNANFSIPPPFYENNGFLDDVFIDVPSGEMCTFQFTMAGDITNTAEFQVAQVRIYDLAPGGGTLAGLGDFNTAVPLLDVTYQVADGSLVITDTGVDDAGGNDLIVYEAVGSNFPAPYGNYGVFVNFPDATQGGLAGQAVAPATGGATECAHTWGPDVIGGVPFDLCPGNGPQYENLAFEVRSQLRAFRHVSSPALATVDLGTVTDTLVTGAATCSIVDMDVYIAIDHTWAGDLIIDVTHDDTATNMTLFDYNVNGIGNDDLVGLYGWSDNAAAVSWASVAGTDPLPNVFYLADDGQTMAATWGGLDVASDWTLAVTDDAGGDQGTVNAWGIVGVCQP